MDVDSDSIPPANPGSEHLQTSGNVSAVAAVDALEIQSDSNKTRWPGESDPHLRKCKENVRGLKS